MTKRLDEFISAHREFLEYLLDWRAAVPEITLAEIISDDPRRVALACVDLIKGFTSHGRLASPRIAGIVPNVARLLEAAYAAGVRDFAFLQDSHPADSPEFDAFGAHCSKDSEESEMVDELARLPFADSFKVMPKESLDPAAGTELDPWLDSLGDLSAVIVVGDCTDICVYQLAQHVLTRATAARRRLRVVVPADCVQTYDLSVGLARELGATPHDGDLLHLVFLWHLHLCGVEVVDRVVA